METATQPKKRQVRAGAVSRYDSVVQSLQKLLSIDTEREINAYKFSKHYGINGTTLFVLTSAGYIKRRHVPGRKPWQYQAGEKLAELTGETLAALLKEYGAKSKAESTPDEAPAPVQPEAVQLPLPLGEVEKEAPKYGLVFGHDSTHQILTTLQPGISKDTALEIASKQPEGCLLVQLVAKVEYKPTTTFF